MDPPIMDNALEADIEDLGPFDNSFTSFAPDHDRDWASPQLHGQVTLDSSQQAFSTSDGYHGPTSPLTGNPISPYQDNSTLMSRFGSNIDLYPSHGSTSLGNRYGGVTGLMDANNRIYPSPSHSLPVQRSSYQASDQRGNMPPRIGDARVYRTQELNDRDSHFSASTMQENQLGTSQDLNGLGRGQARIPGFPGAIYTDYELDTRDEKGRRKIYSHLHVPDDSDRYDHQRARDEKHPTDFTSFSAEQKSYSFENLPSIIGFISSPCARMDAKDLQDELGRDVVGPRKAVLKNIPWLPLRISRQVEGWLIDYWQAKGAALNDIVHRTIPAQGKPEVFQKDRNMFSMRAQRYRQEAGRLHNSRRQRKGDNDSSNEQTRNALRRLHPIQILCGVCWKMEWDRPRQRWMMVNKAGVKYDFPQTPRVDSVVYRALMDMDLRVPVLTDSLELSLMYMNKINPYDKSQKDHEWQGVSSSKQPSRNDAICVPSTPRATLVGDHTTPDQTHSEQWSSRNGKACNATSPTPHQTKRKRGAENSIEEELRHEPTKRVNMSELPQQVRKGRPVRREQHIGRTRGDVSQGRQWGITYAQYEGNGDISFESTQSLEKHPSHTPKNNWDMKNFLPGLPGNLGTEYQPRSKNSSTSNIILEHEPPKPTISETVPAYNMSMHDISYETGMNLFSNHVLGEQTPNEQAYCNSQQPPTFMPPSTTAEWNALSLYGPRKTQVGYASGLGDDTFTLNSIEDDQENPDQVTSPATDHDLYAFKNDSIANGERVVQQLGNGCDLWLQHGEFVDGREVTSGHYQNQTDHTSENPRADVGDSLADIPAERATPPHQSSDLATKASKAGYRNLPLTAEKRKVPDDDELAQGTSQAKRVRAEVSTSSDVGLFVLPFEQESQAMQACATKTEAQPSSDELTQFLHDSTPRSGGELNFSRLLDIPPSCPKCGEEIDIECEGVYISWRCKNCTYKDWANCLGINTMGFSSEDPA